jgi:hypothetical protein
MEIDSNTPSFIPASNGELHDFEIVYRDVYYQPARHTVRCRNIGNALKSFARALPRHGKIVAVRKVGA